MKTLVTISFLALSLSVWSKDEVLKFNDALIEQIQKDISDEANDDLRTVPVGRGPASVETGTPQPQEESKIDKSVRQTGGKRW